jgi:glycosyltransferase involved in cell wall biosynthesis
MGIIEKLGITKKPAYNYSDAIDYIRDLEEQRDEMLEALVEEELSGERCREEYPQYIFDLNLSNKRKDIIQKATGKS